MRVGFWFFSVTFRSRVFHSRVFSHLSVDMDEQSSWKLPAFLPNIQNVVTNSSCWQCLYPLISLLYKQLLQYMLLKSFTVPSALLTEFAKKFYTILLASAFIFTKLSTKTLALTPLCFIWVSMTIAKHARIVHCTYCFLSMLKIRCKRHYRNLATYSLCITWREHFTKTAPARRRHLVGGGGAAAAAHSSIADKFGQVEVVSADNSKAEVLCDFFSSVSNDKKEQIFNHWETKNCMYVSKCPKFEIGNIRGRLKN